MALVYLNKDKSVICEIMDNDKVFISSNHTNKKNSKRLVSNISKITTIKKTRDKTIISLNGTPYATINNLGVIKNKNVLTSFETRLFAQGEKIEALPFARFDKMPTKLKTDLHTHFAGAPTPEQLIEYGIGNDVLFPAWILDKAKIDYSYLQANKNGLYKLEDIISNFNNRQLLINAMKIDTSEQETFNKMEEIYAVRGAFTILFLELLQMIQNKMVLNMWNCLYLQLYQMLNN